MSPMYIKSTDAVGAIGASGAHMSVPRRSDTGGATKHRPEIHDIKGNVHQLQLRAVKIP